MCVLYHHIEVSALVSGARWEQAGVFQQIFQQLDGSAQMLLVSTKVALFVHIQQGVNLTLKTWKRKCKQLVLLKRQSTLRYTGMG